MTSPGLAFVSFHGLAPNTRFDPQLLTLDLSRPAVPPGGVGGAVADLLESAARYSRAGPGDLHLPARHPGHGSRSRCPISPQTPTTGETGSPASTRSARGSSVRPATPPRYRTPLTMTMRPLAPCRTSRWPRASCATAGLPTSTSGSAHRMPTGMSSRAIRCSSWPTPARASWQERAADAVAAGSEPRGARCLRSAEHHAGARVLRRGRSGQVCAGQAAALALVFVRPPPFRAARMSSSAWSSGACSRRMCSRASARTSSASSTWNSPSDTRSRRATTSWCIVTCCSTIVAASRSAIACRFPITPTSTRTRTASSTRRT